MRGFVTIRAMDGHSLGYGSMSQFVHAGRITYRMTYRFRDGSLDDEIAVFSEGRTFELLSDRHVQRGPIFAHPLDLTIRGTGDTSNRTLDGKGKAKVETSHLELPPGTVVVGMMCTLMANFDPATQSLKLPALSPTPKPRLFHFAITREAPGTFRIAGSRQTAAVFRVKSELGGIAGVVAPLLDKQPDDILVWVLEGDAPAVVRAVGQLSEGGPLLDIQIAGARFPAVQR
jgi:hypothetical protein